MPVLPEEAHPEPSSGQLPREHAENYEDDGNEDDRYEAADDATTLVCIDVEARLAIRRAI